MNSYENGYWGITAKKHQKMRPSKRRKLNTTGKYDTNINTKIYDMVITLPDGKKVGCEFKTDVITIST